MRKRAGRLGVICGIAMAAFGLGAACSTSPCPILGGFYDVSGTCSGPERCPLSQSACSGTLVCSTSGLACMGEVDAQGNATFTCGGPLGSGPCSGSRDTHGVIALQCQPPGGACDLTLTPVGDAGG